MKVLEIRSLGMTLPPEPSGLRSISPYHTRYGGEKIFFLPDEALCKKRNPQKQEDPL
jgi:hypothetical protein